MPAQFQHAGHTTRAVPVPQPGDAVAIRQGRKAGPLARRIAPRRYWPRHAEHLDLRSSKSPPNCAVMRTDRAA